MRQTCPNPMNPHTEQSLLGWRIIAVIAPFPAILYLCVLGIGAIGITDPAIWVSNQLFGPTWAPPFLLVFVLGGPVMSIIADLILELRHEKERPPRRVRWLYAFVLLVAGFVTTVPVPWIFLFE